MAREQPAAPGRAAWSSSRSGPGGGGACRDAAGARGGGGRGGRGCPAGADERLDLRGGDQAPLCRQAGDPGGGLLHRDGVAEIPELRLLRRDLLLEDVELLLSFRDEEGFEAKELLEPLL